MSICASGASTTKPGINTSIVVDGNYVKSLLPAGWSWLYDYLPYMKPLAIGSTSTFCAADPPTWSLPNATDLYQFITGGFVGQNDVVTTFLNKLTSSYLWYSLCQCSTGATPTPAAPPTPPANLPGVNPGTVVTSPAAACAHADSLVSSDPTGVTGGNYLIPDGPFTLPGIPKYPLPTGTTTAVLTAKQIVSGTHHAAQGYTYVFYNAAGTSVLTAAPSLTSGNTLVTTVAVPSTAVSFSSWSSLAAPATSSDSVQLSVDFYCGGTLPGGQSTPCCPPDAISSGLLQQILTTVLLIQRQAVPFAYIPSTVHSGLTGTGTVAVSGILALAVSVTTLPTQLAETAGTPPKLYGVGWLSLATSDGYEAPVYIESQNQLIVPRSAGLVTSVGYSLHSGVVLTLTELVREP